MLNHPESMSPCAGCGLSPGYLLPVSFPLSPPCHICSVLLLAERVTWLDERGLLPASPLLSLLAGKRGCSAFRAFPWG